MHTNSHNEEKRVTLSSLTVTDVFGTTHTLCPHCMKKADGQLWLVRADNNHIYADAALVGYMQRYEVIDGVEFTPHDEIGILVVGAPREMSPELKLVTWHIRITQVDASMAFRHTAACRSAALHIEKAEYGPEHIMMAKRRFSTKEYGHVL